MYLRCPNCGAGYEVDAALIPAEGRDVQCSACEHVWPVAPGHARDPSDRPESPAGKVAADTRRDVRPSMEDDGEDEESGPLGTPAPSRPIADSVRAILREEAEREARMRRERGEPDPDFHFHAGDRAEGSRAGPATLPDPTEIGATLRAAEARADDVRQEDTGRGFAVGFGVSIAILVVAAAIYLGAPLLAREAPGLRPALVAYVSAVNDLRGVIDAMADRASDGVSALIQRLET